MDSARGTRVTPCHVPDAPSRRRPLPGGRGEPAPCLRQRARARRSSHGRLGPRPGTSWDSRPWAASAGRGRTDSNSQRGQPLCRPRAWCLKPHIILSQGNAAFATGTDSIQHQARARRRHPAPGTERARHGHGHLRTPPAGRAPNCVRSVRPNTKEHEPCNHRFPTTRPPGRLQKSELSAFAKGHTLLKPPLPVPRPMSPGRPCRQSSLRLRQGKRSSTGEFLHFLTTQFSFPLLPQHFAPLTTQTRGPPRWPGDLTLPLPFLCPTGRHTPAETPPHTSCGQMGHPFEPGLGSNAGSPGTAWTRWTPTRLSLKAPWDLGVCTV